MKRVLAFLTVALTISAFAVHAQSTAAESATVSHFAPRPRTFFPNNWVRGYTDFSVAPSHNEPDLGRCMFPQPASASGMTFTCTSLARYLYIRLILFEPFVLRLNRFIFLFFKPHLLLWIIIPPLFLIDSFAP